MRRLLSKSTQNCRKIEYSATFSVGLNKKVNKSLLFFIDFRLSPNRLQRLSTLDRLSTINRLSRKFFIDYQSTMSRILAKIGEILAENRKIFIEKSPKKRMFDPPGAPLW